ncbi:MAG TPA: penicillin acylase family protein [Candidatus Paceibacterota bacterium]|nr:penicillin acylase family protein [Candidatus Paceibacterota bacterium]HRZ56776.1 penicillin acylase family protein [Candidatus Paceibacterota bacterium]
MKILRPLLPQSQTANVLLDWDLKYSADSEGAWRFEQFYAQLYREVFGKGGLGEQVVDVLRTETGAFIDFYHNFDRVLLSEASAWFGTRTREEIFRTAGAAALKSPPKTWGETHQFMMTNIFFNGRLPRFLGFDRGPYVAIGSRATIHQAQLYRSHGRETSFLPSYRFIADLGEDHIHTTLAGSPSDRRFSRWYASNLTDWLQGRYKTLATV